MEDHSDDYDIDCSINEEENIDNSEQQEENIENSEQQEEEESKQEGRFCYSKIQDYLSSQKYLRSEKERNCSQLINNGHLYYTGKGACKHR